MWKADYDKSKLSELQVLTRKDLTKGGKSLIPAKFYVHTYHNDNLEEHHSEPGDDFIGKWNLWLDDNRVYVDKPKTVDEPKINQDLLI